MIRIGIDIGGTFTDFVFYDSEKNTYSTFKISSTPDNPAEAVIQGLQLISDGKLSKIIHGSTVATNALLERKGVRTALISTKGFKDIIQIGRQNRQSLYDLFIEPLPPIISSDMRFEIDERVEHTGEILKSINTAEIGSLIDSLKSNKTESVAICLLFSYIHPKHEELLAEHLRQAGFFITCSNELLPEFREYERCSTTAVNAYISPILARYLASLERSMQSTKIHIMQSNGGMIDIDHAKQFGVRCILSGPAGGVIGANYIASSISQGESVNEEKIITFDMGGTSTDISLINHAPTLSKESVVGGMPIAIPLLDIHTVGAGGGSIASVDPGGALRVGPESAGAHPGPACYGVGRAPTVTDANLVLGRIIPDHFLGGKIKLDIHRASQSINRLGDSLGMGIHETALGIIEVVNAHMERALRVGSVEKGYDPRDFSLFTFGGAGGLHATALARRLGIPQVIIPSMASTLSAFGMLCADFIKDYSKTVMITDDAQLTILDQTIESLTNQGLCDLRQAGFIDTKIRIETSVDVRYVGQSYELTIPYSRNLIDDFALTHQDIYGYKRANAKIEIVNARVRASGLTDKPIITRHSRQTHDPSPAFLKESNVYFSEGTRLIPVYQGEKLKHGNHVQGPAIIIRSDTTILLDSFEDAAVDSVLNLIIRIKHPQY